MILASHGLIASSISQGVVPLLDVYGSASGAFSIRKLRTAYTGNAIRVRRTDLSEQNIGFTANGNLDTTALMSFVGTGSMDNGFVTTWYDQSGNSLNATQTTALLQPKIVNAGAYLGCVSFVGIAFSVLRSSMIYAASQSFSSFIVCQNEGFSIFGNTNNPFYGVAQPDNPINSFSNFSTPSYFKNGIAIGTTRVDIFNATTSLSLLSTLSSNSTSNATLEISYPAGGIATSNDKYKEIVIYPNQSVSRTGVESNIKTYYGL